VLDAPGELRAFSLDVPDAPCLKRFEQKPAARTRVSPWPRCSLRRDFLRPLGVHKCPYANVPNATAMIQSPKNFANQPVPLCNGNELKNSLPKAQTDYTNSTSFRFASLELQIALRCRQAGMAEQILDIPE
jgi:hypothetical protein